MHLYREYALEHTAPSHSRRVSFSTINQPGFAVAHRNFLHNPPTACPQVANSARWSRKITLAALWPGAPVTPPPGWAPEPQ